MQRTMLQLEWHARCAISMLIICLQTHCTHVDMFGHIVVFNLFLLWNTSLFHESLLTMPTLKAKVEDLTLQKQQILYPPQLKLWMNFGLIVSGRKYIPTLRVWPNCTTLHLSQLLFDLGGLQASLMKVSPMRLLVLEKLDKHLSSIKWTFTTRCLMLYCLSYKAKIYRQK